MNKKLKFKIFSSFFLLIGLLAAATVVSILEFNHIDQTTFTDTENNRNFILLANGLQDALELNQTGVLLILNKEQHSANKLLHESDSLFNKNLKQIQLLEADSAAEFQIKKIEKEFSYLIGEIKSIDKDTLAKINIGWHNNNYRNKILSIKELVKELIVYNEALLFKNASLIEDESHRALMPGIISLISAIIYSFVLYLFILRYIINPIIDISEAVRDYRPELKRLQVKISSNDEIKELEESISDLLEEHSIHAEKNKNE